MTKSITGIDLGTTNSAAAILNEMGKPGIVPNVDGEIITPSLLFFDEDVVGIGSAAEDRAQGLLMDEAHRFVMDIKRKMPDQNHRLSIFGKSHSPAALSALILKNTSIGVAKHRGGVGPVAISVPEYFHESECKATLDAGKVAKLDIASIVTEPTAAAPAYSIDNTLDGNYVVFDFGGGTFDVTILPGKRDNIEVLTTRGDSELGDTDFDELFFDRWCEEYLTQAGVELCLNEMGKKDASLGIRCLHDVQQAKHALSRRNTHSIMLWNGADGKKVKSTITRQQLEVSIAPHLTSAEMLLELALVEASLSVSDTEAILPVGGSTRIPAIANSARKRFAKVPSSNFSPDAVVAQGAAVHAGVSALRNRPKYSMSTTIRTAFEKRKMVDVPNHSYGFLACEFGEEEPHNFIIPKKNTILPAIASTTFYTRCDNQTNRIKRVAKEKATDPSFLPTPIYEAIIAAPPNRPAGQEMLVQYICYENHVLHYKFEDVDSGNMHEVMLEPAKSPASNGDAHDVQLSDLQIQ